MAEGGNGRTEDNVTTPKIIGVFFVAYASLWIAPVIITYPVDWLLETIQGYEFVDNWTPGLMAWVYVVVAAPVLLLVFLGFRFFVGRRHR